MTIERLWAAWRAAYVTGVGDVPKGEGSAFLCNHCRLPGKLQHESYIANWLQALRNDKRLIFTAASLAQKAADYLLPKPTEVAAVMPLADAA